MSIDGNIARVREDIAAAAKKSGRSPEDVLLVGVTKTVEVERMRQAQEAGIVEFGENRVQEWMSKYEFFSKNIRWHLIGQLQKNKVRYIINKIDLVHSLSSLSVAEEIQRLCVRDGAYMDCLVQVNVSKEDSKSGIYEEDVDRFLESVSRLDKIRIKGLMTIAPVVQNPEEARPYFARLREIGERYSSISSPNFSMDLLSMGMSSDYTVAIEEGANIVRVGSSIFGHRNYR